MLILSMRMCYISTPDPFHILCESFVAYLIKSTECFASISEIEIGLGLCTRQPQRTASSRFQSFSSFDHICTSHVSSACLLVSSPVGHRHSLCTTSRWIRGAATANSFFCLAPNAPQHENIRSGIANQSISSARGLFVMLASLAWA